MTLTEIERTLCELRLSGIAATLNTRVMQAQSSQQPLLETLAGLLQDELDRRHSRLTERRFKQSRLDERPTVGDFDWRPKLPCQACVEVANAEVHRRRRQRPEYWQARHGQVACGQAVAYQATLYTGRRPRMRLPSCENLDGKKSHSLTCFLLRFAFRRT